MAIDDPVLVKDIFPGTTSSLFNMADKYTEPAGDYLFFSAIHEERGVSLWKSNGTDPGTSMVKDIRPDSFGSGFWFFASMGRTLFFAATDDTHGFELWRSDGTATGTTILLDINPGTGSGLDFSYDWNTTVVNNHLYFVADDGQTGKELWKTDGTPAGTSIVKDGRPGWIGSDPKFLTAVGSRLFYIADYGWDDDIVWVSDGSDAGTTVIESARTMWFAHVSPLAAAGDTVYFAHHELWKTDGTDEGTTLVKDIRPGDVGSQPQFLKAIGSTIFFGANDGSGFAKPWKSDGTDQGTTIVKDTTLGHGSLVGLPSVVSEDILYFVAGDAVNGGGLWRTDGTDAGTYLVNHSAANLWPGTTPYHLTAIDGMVFYSLDDGVSGRELWVTDGTDEGTTRVADIRPGPESSDPMDFTKVGSFILFSAYTDERGRELYRISLDGNGPQVTRVERWGQY